MDLVDKCLTLAKDPKQTRWICPLLLVVDAVLCSLVVWKIRYTEIDWKAYMQQIETYIAGERNYLKISGDTGPLVYPAAHVYIYRALYTITDEGQDIATAQKIFGVLYLTSLGIAMSCYMKAKVPPYVFPLLIASKRLHSVFVLRLFNDCFAVFFLFLAINLYQRRLWTLGSLSYSFGLGVKMSMLLVLPAIGMVLLQSIGRNRALGQATFMLQVQLVIAYPFVAENPIGYTSRAFEFTRQFLFKWTVNWRFVGEDTFLSKPFSMGLLTAHGVLLAVSAATRWLKPSRYSIPEAVQRLLRPPLAKEQETIFQRTTPDFILTTVLTAMLIGCLCARSLHYQFYAYIALSTPFLLWRSGMHPILMYTVWGAQEWAWNVYPSTSASSMVVVASLALTVAGSWWGTMDRVGDSVEHKHIE